MSISRENQGIILTTLSASYPGPTHRNSLLEVCYGSSKGLTNEIFQNFMADIHYLAEHNFIELLTINIKGESFLEHARITAAGIDFIEDDGGVTEALKTVTVRFDPENIRKLLEEKVVSFDLPEKEKTGLIEKIKQLPANALEKVTNKMLDEFMSNPTAALGVLTSLIN